MINYTYIADAVRFYNKVGFKYIDVPWVVDDSISNITKPPHARNFPFKDKVLVASGEQSFLQLIKDKALPNGAYMCVTPCFRDEQVLSETHKQYFMKVELIQTDDVSKERLLHIIDLCHYFFNDYLDCKDVELPDGTFDIESSTGIELGSYGIRSYPGIGPWIYATGCAEPRLSYAIQK